jgi:glycosyltransferase involved in cell wall biosynthesis
MRILAITAGAGQMYCGSCLRDNALAAELTRRGHDITLLPVYTPTVTDEPNVSRKEVLLGGISVYLAQHVPLFRRTPKWLDRLWDAPGVIRAATKRSISTDPRMLGDMTVAMLRGESGPFRKEFDKLVDWLRDEPAPDLTVLPNSLLISLAGPIRRATGRPVGVTLQGEDLFLSNLGEPYRSQAIRLIGEHARDVDGFFAVSAFYAPAMAGMLGIDPARIHVLPLGVRVQDFQVRASLSHGAPRVGFFGRIAPEKGLHVLAAAYRMLRASGRLNEGTLEAAGYLAPEHHAYLAKIVREMRDAGLLSEFRYHGALDRAAKVSFLSSLDVFSMPVTYDEPKALSAIEAMASGVPVVEPKRGACQEIVEKTGGGLLVEPDNPAALADGLAAVLNDRALWSRLSQAAVAGAREHYDIGRMAERALEVYGSVVTRGRGTPVAGAPSVSR